MGVRGMARFLCCCVVWILSFQALTAEAARQKPVVRPASAQDKFVKGGTTLDIERHWGEVVDVPGGTVNLPVVQASKYNPSRISGLIKNLIKSNPLKIAGTAVAVYLIDKLPGASFDPVTGQPLMTTPGGLMPMTSGYMYWMAQESPFVRGASVESTCRSHAATKTTNSRYISHTVYQDSGGGFCVYGPVSQPHITFSVNITRHGNLCPPGGAIDTVRGGCYGYSTAPMTDAQLDQLVSSIPSISDAQWGQVGNILNDIPGSFDYADAESFDGPSSVQGEPTVTTTLDQVTGNTTVSETTPTYNFDYSTNPLSITSSTTVTTNTYNNGVHTGTTTTVESPVVGPVTPTEPAPEVPTDCDFMPTVCGFIDWVKTPFDEDEPDLSELIADEDHEKEFNFNSNASCPAPLPMNTDQGDFEFSFEPACDFAGMLKPFILIGALIAAIYINLGIGRAD